MAERGDGMVSYMKGDLFECGADCLVNAVNCEGEQNYRGQSAHKG